MKILKKDRYLVEDILERVLNCLEETDIIGEWIDAGNFTIVLDTEEKQQLERILQRPSN